MIGTNLPPYRQASQDGEVDQAETSFTTPLLNGDENHGSEPSAADQPKITSGNESAFSISIQVLIDKRNYVH